MSTALMTNVDKKLLRTTKFPPEFDKKVDMTKVNVPVIKKWVADEIARILNSDDDVVAELIYNVLEETRYPKIKELQIMITGFLDKDAASFSKELWKHLLSAQDMAQGVPQELLEAKKQELERVQLEEDKAREEASRRQAADRQRERDIARIREQERGDRSDRRSRGGRLDRGDERRGGYRDSYSPPPRIRDDRYRGPPPARGIDSYVPGRSQRDDRPRRRRSPSYSRSRSRSRSDSPPPRRRRRRNSSSLSRTASPPPREANRRSHDRSRSRDRDSTEKKSSKRGDHSRKSHSRSPAYKRRSQSPRRRDHRRRRRSPSYSRSRSRSPSPKKRSRRDSPSRSRSPPPRRRRRNTSSPRSTTPPKRANKSTDKADLMSKADRHDDRRLSRESTNRSASRRRTPQQEKSDSKSGEDRLYH